LKSEKEFRLLASLLCPTAILERVLGRSQASKWFSVSAILGVMAEKAYGSSLPENQEL
jgi:hypothetical protein